MKKIVIINGHPNKESLNFEISSRYKKGALKSKAEVKEITISDLNFNPNLKQGYQQRTILEPDLLAAWNIIKWADHLVWIHPVWWGGLPAVTKAFIDRLFLPGFAFNYIENSIKWEKLLAGKTAHIITTLDQPSWYYRWGYGRPSINQLKKSTLAFCGIKTKKVTYFENVKTAKPNKLNSWLNKAENLGYKQI
ncbi:putative NADPH-quinone reductase [Wenyingzhuangia heitensis]|uniref:NADPH-quinone reductase n=1 Tax=Wenyingzhuangia heitensis TaxID=1487859 RepID=A0ABX0U6C7_9FLAO|nr:NAD(P)H-dependent oxidoreductase [Wenyingzhuangia heitensis]NIJ44407.1 putative NADPH-quinone reductase [Wenyingzhuangia heitensis]